MGKSSDAFRTISEVADWLEEEAHVLRFWESKFSQVKPLKRAGGRRYYRPNDMLLLGGLKKLLHEDGITIKAAQKILRDKGNSYVMSLSRPTQSTSPIDFTNTEETPHSSEKIPKENSQSPPLSDTITNTATPDAPSDKPTATQNHFASMTPSPETKESIEPDHVSSPNDEKKQRDVPVIAAEEKTILQLAIVLSDREKIVADNRERLMVLYNKIKSLTA